jgi:hypothetical protein
MRRARREPAERDDVSPVAEVEAGAESERSLAAQVTQLQRAAGNKAVGSLLAREGDKDKGDKDAATSTTLIMPDPIGVLPVVNFRIANTHEIDVFVPNTDADPKLFNAAAQGTVFGLVTISTGSGFSITIDKAVIASVQVSSNGLMLSIDGAVAQKGPDTQSPPGSIDMPTPKSP